MTQHVRQALPHACGFTLVELMVTVAIAALLATLALPSFREVAVRSNVAALTNQLVLSLQTARAEAVRRGTWVEVKSGQGSSWGATGWQVVPDDAFNSTFSGATIDTATAAPGGYSVCGRVTTVVGFDGSDGVIVFGPSGELASSRAFDFSINRPDRNTALAQHITVKQSGVIQSGAGATTGLTGC